jgi:hypothetical protein
VKSFYVAFAMLVASSTAYAQQGTMGGSAAVMTDAPTDVQEVDNARATQEAQESGERLICRRMENSRSRMGRRQVCLTARQWRERQ